MYNILQDVLFALVLKNPSKEWYIEDTDKQAHEVSFLFASLSYNLDCTLSASPITEHTHPRLIKS